MKLPFKRSKSKKAKATDVLESIARLWTELRISKHASKGIEKSVSRARTTPAKAIGGLALLGGAGALVARKLKGGGPEPLPYVPPPPMPWTPPAAADPVPAKAPSIAAAPVADEVEGYADAGAGAATAGEDADAASTGGDIDEPGADEPR